MATPNNPVVPPKAVSVQKVAVVTDSSCCLPQEVAAAEGIEVVSIEMTFQGRAFIDGQDDPHEFYRLLRRAKTTPKTSAPSPGRFLEAYLRAAQRATSVLCLTLPANLSAIHAASQQAAKLAEEGTPAVRVVTVEAGAVAAGQGLLALEAARVAASGADLDQVAGLVHALAPRVHFFAVLETLDYLARGGHVPKVAAWLGNMIGVRPILTAPNGDVRRITQARSRRAAMERLLALMEQRNPGRAPIQALVMHADAAADAQMMRGKVQERFPCKELLITPFTAVMGAHSGPGVVGVAFRVV